MKKYLTKPFLKCRTKYIKIISFHSSNAYQNKTQKQKQKLSLIYIPSISSSVFSQDITGPFSSRDSHEDLNLSAHRTSSRDSRIIITRKKKNRMSTDFKSIPLIGTFSFVSIDRMRTLMDPMFNSMRFDLGTQISVLFWPSAMIRKWVKIRAWLKSSGSWIRLAERLVSSTWLVTFSSLSPSVVQFRPTC